MGRDGQELSKLVGQAPIEIERVRLLETGVAIEGPFTLPPLAQLSADDQIFVAAFVRCHGSIKQMEKYFGVSYPTIKNRLNRIGEQLPFVEIDQAEPGRDAGPLLDRLERGELLGADVLAQRKNDRTKGEQP